jgi:hypothetical protein
VPDANITIAGSNENRTITINPAANRSGVATITVTVDDGANDPVAETFQLTVTPVNDPPTVAPIGDQSTDEDTPIGPISLVLGDVDTPLNSLTVTASSSNPSLVPAANVIFGGSGGNRTITINPAANRHGTVTITVGVSDGGPTPTETSFSLVVDSINDPPTISEIPNQSTSQDMTTDPIPLAIGDVETPAASLTLTVSSNNQALVPNGNIVVGGLGTNRTLTITPASNQTGSATITVTVRDADQAQATESFVLEVSQGVPTISPIADQTVPEDTSTGALGFTVGDGQTPPGSLIVSGSSANTTLVPNQNIVFGGSGANRTVRITPAPNRSGQTTFSLAVRDGDGLTATEDFVVTVTAVNDAPVNTVPGPQVADGNGSVQFSVSNGNVIAVSDLDAGTNDVSLKLAVNNGSLSVAGTAGLTAVAGNGSNSVSLSGPIAAVNSALDGLTFTATPTFDGTDVLTLVTDDLGHTGGGGPRIDSDTIVILVSDRNRAPEITSSDAVTVPEGATVVLTVTAVDPDNDPVSFTISGGADQAAFAINSITGTMSFGAPPDFDNPTDANGDNIYEVEVQARDADGAADNQLIRVTVSSATAPTVTMADVTPNRRAGPVADISIVFSEPVTGLDLGDLRLTRSTNSTVSLLPGSATLTTTDNVTWKLGNLTTITSASGIYELTLAAAGSGIKDLGGAALVQGDVQSWINGPGDANLDNAFDQFDLIEVLRFSKYNTGLTATWGQGDWTGDNLFSPVDIIAALQAGHYLQGAYGAVAGAAELAAESSPAADLDVAVALPAPTVGVADGLTATDAAFAAVAHDDSAPVLVPADGQVSTMDGPINSLALDLTLAKASVDDGEDELGF